MGNYLEVTKKGDISTAVTTIVDAFRPMLKITKRDYKQLQAISTTNIEKPRVAVHPAKADTVALQPLPVKPAPKPDTVAKVVIPKKTNIQVDVVEQRTPLAKLTRIAPTRMRKLFTSARVTVKFQEEDLVVPEIKQKDTIAVILNPPAPKLTRLKTTRMKRLATTVNLNDDNFQPIRLNVPVISITDTIVPPPAPRPQEPKVTRIKPTHIKSFGHVFMIEESIFPLVKLTPPVINIPDVKTNGDKPKPTGTTPKLKTTPKTGEYSVMHDDARETTLEVYLTNGRGKFYYTTPKVFLTDPATNKEFKHFYRTVDGSNNPDPVKNIPAGKYDLTIDGREDLLAHVDVLPNKKTLVYVIVKDYSLFFTYEGAPERPVKEFSAIVIQRNNNNGKVVNQKCTEKLVYEPGNYHIIINTLPEDVRNVDLDNMDAGGIVIPQPGFADFLAEGPAKSVTLFKELGDKFVSFHVVNLTDPEAKHLMIQPGKYQAHYQNGQTKFASTEKVIPFVITSNQTTPVFLK